MTGVIKRWGEVHKIFNPSEPATAELRVERTKYNPLSEKIGPRLRLPLDHQKYVIAGGIGSGKSTELLATAAQLADSQLVVLVDLLAHFQSTIADPSALEHLQPAELIGLLGLAILRAGEDHLGHAWGAHKSKLEQALREIQVPSPTGEATSSIDVAKLAGGLAVFVGGAVGTLAGPGGARVGAGAAQQGLKLFKAVSDSTTWPWKIGLRGRERSSDQDPKVRRVLEATNALLDSIRATYKKNVVLIVDGLDRVRRQETFEDLFVDSGLLGELRCRYVTALDLGLTQRYRSRLRWCEPPLDFTYVPVAERAQPEQYNSRGVEFFEALAARRFKSLKIQAPIPSPQLQRLAYCSGGHLRDFMSLVREVAINAMLEELSEATAACVEAAIDSLRRGRESGLNADQIATLQSVLDDPHRKLPAGEIALDLLERELLLAYPNESTWYLPHTILMQKMLRQPGSAA